MAPVSAEGLTTAANERPVSVESPPTRVDNTPSPSAPFPAAGDNAPNLVESVPSADDRPHADRPGFPPAARITTTSSGRPYSSFSVGTRWLIVSLAGIAAVFSPIRQVHDLSPIRRHSRRSGEETGLMLTRRTAQTSLCPPSLPFRENSTEAKNRYPSPSLSTSSFKPSRRLSLAR